MPHTEVVFYQEDNQALVFQWMKKLPAKVQDKCQAYLGQLEDFGYELRRPVTDLLRDGIYELRPSYQSVHYRMLYFFPKRDKEKATEPPKIVVVSHGLVKEEPCRMRRLIGPSNGRGCSKRIQGLTPSGRR